jgi:hypothetical protein
MIEKIKFLLKMKRARSEHVFEDSDKVEPYVWRNEFVDVFSKHMLNYVCDNYTKWRTTEETYGERKGLKKGEACLAILAGLDIPDSIMEPRFDGTWCYLSLTRFKQLKPFARDFRHKVTEYLSKELKLKNIFKHFDFGVYLGDQSGVVCVRFEFWLEK